MLKTCILVGVLIVFASQSNAQSFTLEVDIPIMNVSEYHAPYIATWIETTDRNTVVATSLWYDNQTKWLKDIRQWWRKTGRGQQAPYDGVVGATRRPGKHKLHLDGPEIAAKLKPGSYVLLIEAAREVGGREVLRLPFNWPTKDTFQTSVQGKQELGKVTLTINP